MTALDEAMRSSLRSVALTVPCRHCAAAVGEECVSPTTGLELVKQPACRVRLQDAGVMPRGEAGGHG